MAEKKTTQTKASMRNGRATKGGAVYNANHNTLESIRRGQPHIDDQMFELNRYWKFTIGDRQFDIKRIDGGKGGFDARKHELAIYEKLYGGGLAARNERYTREGHKDRCQTIKNLYSNPKTAPLETIFQIGNSQMILDGVMGPEEMKQKLTAAWDKTMRQVVAMGRGMVIPLDAALHCEEAVPHIHFRAAMGARDKYGHFVPNQSAALKAMGFDGRNPETGKKDRYHNPLVAYTDRVREIFYTECEKQGLVIDREVTSESHRQVEIMAFKLEKAKQDVATAQEQLRQMELENAEARRTAQEALEALQRETDTTQGRLEALRGSEAVLTAKNEHLSDYNTKLEERKAEVIQEGQNLARENRQLKAVNKQLRETDASLREQIRELQEEVDSLNILLGQLQREQFQLQAETEKAKADRAAALEAAQAMEKHQKELFDRQNSRLVREYGTIPARPEKKNLRGHVIQEARPECVVVAKEDLERVEEQAKYNIHVHYTEAKIKELDKRISENEVIQELKSQVEQQHREITSLRNQNTHTNMQLQDSQWAVQQYENFLRYNGLGQYIIPTNGQREQTGKDEQDWK